jgi:hypothetical protein
VWIGINHDNIQHQTYRVSRDGTLILLPTLTIQFRCSPYRCTGWVISPNSRCRKRISKNSHILDIRNASLFGSTKILSGNAQSRGNLKIHPISPRSINLMNSDPDQLNIKSLSSRSAPMSIFASLLLAPLSYSPYSASSSSGPFLL